VELFLLKVVAFLRPIFFIEVSVKIAGFNFFELMAILSFVALFLAFAVNTTLTKNLRLSAIDLLIIGFIFWCLTVYVVYAEKATIDAVAKLIIPPITYILAKNIIPDRQQYRKVLLLLIAGFALPVVLSTGMIALGHGIQKVNYWTGLPRYQGAYSGPHNMAHNMTFLLMTIALYIHLSRQKGAPDTTAIPAAKRVLFMTLGALASYCLFASPVRTAILGLFVFLAHYLYLVSRKLLIIGAAGLLAIGIIFSPILIKKYGYDAQQVYEGEWRAEKLGSGRPLIWMHNLSEFRGMTIDRQLGGVGIGNTLDASPVDFDPDNIRNSHNDYLEVLIQTGIVGFLLFIALQFLILIRILRLPGNERNIFLPIFVAVTVMNFVSNSYVSRFGLGQMYYLLLAYIELPTQDKAGS
jgi:O-antigen ligase